MHTWYLPISWDLGASAGVTGDELGEKNKNETVITCFDLTKCKDLEEASSAITSI
jgi:hypothetical protein